LLSNPSGSLNSDSRLDRSASQVPCSAEPRPLDAR